MADHVQQQILEAVQAVLVAASIVPAGRVYLDRAIREGGDDGWARWTMGAIAAGIVVHSLLYSALFEDPFTWVLAGAAVALAAPRPDPLAEARPEAPEAVPVPSRMPFL
jgi:hypothetical protein